jgi:hypothetical protein
MSAGCFENVGLTSRWTKPLASVLLVAALLATGSAPAPAAGKTAPSTQEMAATLKDLGAKVNAANLPFVVNDRRAAHFAEELTFPRRIAERLHLRVMFARELLNAGQIDECLQAIDVADADAKENAPPVWQALQRDLPLLRALAYMRLGEEQNCHLGNTADSCLLPIRGQGVHKRREGSARAIQILDAYLLAFPDSLQARWLLNIAHMTLGTWPDAVTPAHVVPPGAFASDYALPRFDNVAREAGIDVYGISGGAITDDFDGDGRLDVVLSAIGFSDPLRFFWNRGDGTFEERADQVGLTGEVGGLNLIQADYDNDGHLDFLVLRGGWMWLEGRFPMSLLRNNGDGSFADVTRAAGLFRLKPTQTATWLDYDGDGWLDLYVGNESMPKDTDPKTIHPAELFHNERDGTFSEVAAASGVAVVGFVKGVASGDYDNDGRPDLFVSLQNADNLLFHNDGPPPTAGGAWRFSEVAAHAGVQKPNMSFGSFFFDYDNDGWQDLFVVGYSQTTSADVAADYLGLPTTADRLKLYRNRGDGTFEDVSARVGLDKVVPAMGHNFGDLDNDGWLDVYLGTGNPDLGLLIPNRMFRNDGGRAFQDVTVAGNFGHIQKGHAVAFADLDEDGDQDVVEQMGGAHLADRAYTTLYRNPGNENRWLVLELAGTTTNRRAIGARIKVTVEGKGGTRAIHRVVSSGGSFGANPLRQEIGLGDATRVASVEIAWPVSGKTQRVTGLQTNTFYRIREGDAAATPVPRKPFQVGGR